MRCVCCQQICLAAAARMMAYNGACTCPPTHAAPISGLCKPSIFGWHKEPGLVFRVPQYATASSAVCSKHNHIGLRVVSGGDSIEGHVARALHHGR
jgi:hypothetical protein